MRLSLCSISWAEKVMAELLGSDTPHTVQRLQRINDHPVDLVLPLVHLHLSVVGEQLPVAPRGHFSVLQLLLCHNLDLRIKTVLDGHRLISLQFSQALYFVFKLKLLL